MSGVARDCPGPILLINVPGNNWYQDGAPGISGDLAGIARFIEATAQRLGIDRIVTIGSSMGAYAAICVGDLVI